MASRRPDERGQMILLAGILLVLAYLVYSTQTALLATVGQEGGREGAQPLRTDYQSIRTGLAGFLQDELRDAQGVARCPTDATDWGGRVQTILTLLEQLEANRGIDFQGHFQSVVVPATNLDADSALELQTTVQLFVTNGEGAVGETVVMLTECV